MRSAEHFQPAAPHRRPTRAETTGTRPSTWSRWHRHALPAWAFSCDVDCLEIRAGRGIVAVIETGEVDGLPTEARLRAIAKSKSLQLRAIEEIGAALAVPRWFVLHSRTLSRAAVLDLETDTVREVTGAQMQTLIDRL